MPRRNQGATLVPLGPQPSSVEVRLRLLQIGATCGLTNPEDLMAFADRLRAFVYKRREVDKMMARADSAGVPIVNPPKTDNEAIERIHEHLTHPTAQFGRTHEQVAARRAKTKSLCKKGALLKDIRRAIHYNHPQTLLNDLNFMGIRYERGVITDDLEVSIGATNNEDRT